MSTIGFLDKKLSTRAFVSIEDKSLDIISLVLRQELAQHHYFKIVMDYDVLKKKFLEDPYDQISLMGKEISIQLQQGEESQEAYEFIGIIQDTYAEGKEGRHGFLVIEGLGNTGLLERGKRLDVFSEMTLEQVFGEVTSGIKNNALSVVNNPAYKMPIDFLMQYYESDWTFLKRLSAISGETLLYTGRDLVFGEYKDWEPTEIFYDREITHFEFGALLLPTAFRHYQYLARKDSTLVQNSPEKLERSNDFLNAARLKGEELVTERPPFLPNSLPVEDMGSLIEMTNRKSSQEASKSVYIKGKSKTCTPRIGRILDIRMPETMSRASDLGTYRVVRVTHTITQGNKYHCDFEAIPSCLKYYQLEEPKMPMASSMRATVIDNADPDNFGRVKVEFPFTRDRKSNTWLRVMTPSAGCSNMVETNRGFVFIPEKGDQVLLGFEFSDPNRPYVMGSLFHGKNTKGGGVKNAEKSIVSSSGVKMVFNDEEKSFHMSDPSGNSSTMDGKGNMSLNTPKNMTLMAGETMMINAKNLKIDVQEHAKNTIGGYLKTSVEGNIETNSGNLKERYSGSVKKKIGDDFALFTGATHIDAYAGDAIFQSADKILFAGKTDVRIGDDIPDRISQEEEKVESLPENKEEPASDNPPKGAEKIGEENSKEEEKKPEGHYYHKDGRYLGRGENEKSEKVYVADSVEKNEKGIVTKVVNAVDLKETHENFQIMSNIIRAESSGDVTESLLIAHVANNGLKHRAVNHRRRKDLYDMLKSGDYSTTKKTTREKRLETTDKSPQSNGARAAIIDVLTGGKDPTKGSVLWDGVDFLAWGLESTKNKEPHNKFKEYLNIYISKEIYNKYESAIKSKYPKGPWYDTVYEDENKKIIKKEKEQYKIPAKVFNDDKNWESGNFDHKTNTKSKNASYHLIATMSYGLSIFWRIEKK